MESKTCFKSKNLSTSIMYLSVVTCNSIRISFLIAAFNDIDILGADTGNTSYLALALHSMGFQSCLADLDV